MINENSQPGRRPALEGATRYAPSEWMRMMVRSAQPMRELMDQWLTMGGQMFPLWIECQRTWERWARSAMGVHWPGAGVVPWNPAAWDPWNAWLRAFGAGGTGLAESVEDLRRQVAALRREVERYQARSGEG